MPSSGASTGNVLTRKAGPLPVWGWAAVAVGGFLIYRKMTGSGSGSSGSSTSGQANPYPYGNLFPYGPGSAGGGSDGGGGLGPGSPYLPGTMPGTGSQVNIQPQQPAPTSPSPGNAATTAAASPGNTGSPALQGIQPVVTAAPNYPGGVATTYQTTEGVFSGYQSLVGIPTGGFSAANPAPAPSSGYFGQVWYNPSTGGVIEGPLPPGSSGYQLQSPPGATSFAQTPGAP